MPTFFEKKQLVTPGELLAEGDYVAGENTYMDGNKVYAQRIGLADAENKRVNVVALRAFYVPKVGDIVIGTVTEVGFNGWTVGIEGPYTALLRAFDGIGRKGSMISTIKQETGCQIILGVNGVILITGKTPADEELAMKAIQKIEEESHTSGLTDRITQLLKEEKPKLEEINNE